jgi:hypothetical protein
MPQILLFVMPSDFVPGNGRPARFNLAFRADDKNYSLAVNRTLTELGESLRDKEKLAFGDDGEIQKILLKVEENGTYDRHHQVDDATYKRLVG